MEQNHTAHKPFSNTEISSFCGQLALVLKSGISSAEGITLLLEDASEPEDKAFLEALLEKLNETASLYEALLASGLFPDYMLHMIKLSEETGTTDAVMEALEKHYAREEAISRTIKNAVAYPMIMTGMMVVVVTILLVKVLPIFNQVFIQLGTEMSGFSKLLTQIGNTIGRYSFAFTLFLAVLIAFILYCTHTTHGKKLFRTWTVQMPFFKNIYEDIAASRFASGMSLCLSSGLTIERSMELVTNLNDDAHFAEKLDKCMEQVREGAELTSALHAASIFTGIYSRMLSIGSKTGNIDSVMNEIAERYEEELDTRMNNALAVLEPTLVIALSIVVGIILLSVMLPLMGIMSSI